MVIHQLPPLVSFRGTFREGLLKLTRRRLKIHGIFTVHEFQPPLVSPGIQEILEFPDLRLTRERLKIMDFQTGLPL